MKKTVVITSLCLCFGGAVSFAQTALSKSELKQLEKNAEFYFEAGNYLAALPIYLELINERPDEIDHKFRAGICYLKKTDEKEFAVNYLEQVLKNSLKLEDIHYYLGRAYHLNYKFDMAVEQFNLANDGKTSKKNKELISLYVNYCNSAKELVAKPVDVRIENLGPPINTEGSEYGPVITSDESVLIYTYRGQQSTGGLLDKYGSSDEKGQYYEDVFISYRLGNSWLDPEGIDENINSKDHDAAVALSQDGQKLFTYRDTYAEASGELYVSELDSNLWTTPEKLNENVNSPKWECSASLSPDEQTLYFSSTKKGGLGGRDIWRSRKQEDGTWGSAENLGPNVNTPQDDDASFIHPDGKTLYFSSKGHNSMGGFDVFRAVLQADDNSFSAPVNLGYPINTTDDDIYYVVAANGERGYYSSGRSGGFGQQDIYVVHLGTSESKALVMVKGEVTANDQVAEAFITVTYADTDELQGTYKSNAATGNYLINLPPGHEYSITYEVDGFPVETASVDAKGVEGYKEEIIDVRLYKKDYIPRLTILGKLTYDGMEVLPASDIKLLIAADDGSWTEYKSTVTNKMGAFRFVNLPSDKNFIICLEAADVKLSPGQLATIDGKVLYGGEPKAGLLVNDVKTNQEGKFLIKDVCPEGFVFKGIRPEPYSIDTKPLNDVRIPANILAKYGDAAVDGLIFKVQIAAFFSPQNYNYSHLKGLGKVEKLVLADGITRFTIGGNFNTLNKALSQKQKVISNGTEDAFITALYNGKRKLLSELAANNFYQ